MPKITPRTEGQDVGFISVATPADLEALPASGLPDGAFAMVGVVYDSYRLVLHPSAALLAAVDSANVLSVTGVTGAVWSRLYIANQEAWYQDTWHIETTGNDANDGLTIGTALRTISELARRLDGAHIKQNVTVHVGPGTFNMTERASATLRSLTIDLGIAFLWYGDVSQGTPNAIATHVVGVPATNTASSFTTAAGAYNFGDRLRLVSGAATGALSYVQTSSGVTTSPQVQRWTRLATDTSIVPTLVDPADGDLVVVETLNTTIDGFVNFFANQSFGTLIFLDCIMGGDTVSSSAGLTRCRLTATFLFVSQLVQCDVRNGSGSRWEIDGAQCQAYATRFTGIGMVQENSWLGCFRSCSFNELAVQIERMSMIEAFNGNDLQLANASVNVQKFSCFECANGVLWGTCTTNPLFRIQGPGCVIAYGTMVCTTTGTFALVAAQAKTSAQLPFTDTVHFCAFTTAP